MRFVALKSAQKVIPENGNAFTLNAKTKVRVVVKNGDVLTVKTLDQRATFFISEDEVEDTEPFKVGHVYYDQEMREYVLVSNGRCVLNHSSPKAFEIDHEKGTTDCVYAPTEATVIRCRGAEVIESADVLVPICGPALRGVNPDDLRDCDITAEEFHRWLEACTIDD